MLNTTPFNPFPPSTAQLNASGGSSGEVAAEDVTYDNTDSGLTADNVQAAIDEIKSDIPTSLAAENVTYDNSDSGLTAENVQAAIDEVNAKTAIGGDYITTGLTTENCTIVAGGFCKIGKLVIVNIRATKIDAGLLKISGFPAYTNRSASNMVPAAAFNMTDETLSDISYCAINAAGVLTIKSSSTNKDMAVSVVYLCD